MKYSYVTKSLPHREKGVREKSPRWGFRGLKICSSPISTPGTLMTSAAADVINHNAHKNRSIQTYPILLCKDDVGSIMEPTSSLVWADVIIADF